MATKTIVDLPAVVDATILVDANTLFEIVDLNEGAPADQSKKLTKGQLFVRLGQTTKHCERAKVGATAGWVVGAGDNLAKLATLPAAQTGSTLVVPISGLKVGSTITGFSLTGSLQSGGNAVSITADLRALTAVAAGATDASIGAMAAPLSVVANTVVSSANASKTGLAEVVAAGKTYYVLVTATSGAACTEELQAVNVTVSEA